ncbi:hypothetical protein OIU79_004357 [Salix purpurea]|uniref:Uncharacterized protein n=1 Tax=Salix purpurea TaxID=77065 RepID=A0A9Q0UA76_SALPP|nr:hypothetical protein OIU79_004357 [Salix purpurea]
MIVAGLWTATSLLVSPVPLNSISLELKWSDKSSETGTGFS